MAKKIYVGNVNFATTESSLNNLFSQYGEVVSANIVMDRVTGRSKGFGFVEMAEDSAAQSAIEALDGKEFEGRQLRVNEAQDKPKTSGGYNDRPRRY
jgi:RNA recognition motif-containing protein